MPQGRPYTMVDNVPTLTELRSYRYVKRAKHSDSGITPGDSGSKPVSFTESGARKNVANVAYAIGNIRFASRHRLPKLYAQNLAQRDDDRVAFRGQRLTNLMFSRVSGQTAFLINFGGNCASCFRCPMTAYNVCSRTTWRTNQRKERWLLGWCCRI